jgi:PAS domain S-box-containing protein
MATSPDYIRIASATRSLTDTAFDAVREAVLVVDTRLRQLPLVLANAAARRCFLGESDAETLTDASLYSLLGGATESAIAAALSSPVNVPGIMRPLAWRLRRGETVVMTELKPLASSLGPSLVMMSFAEPAAEPPLLSAVEQMPLDLLILDKGLTVTYANTGAARTAGATPGGILGCSALALIPTAALARDAFTRALAGEHYQVDAVEVAAPGTAVRHFKVDLLPLKDGSGMVGVAVLSAEITERRSSERAMGSNDRRLLALTEHARDIIAIADCGGRLQYVSGGVTNSLGYAVEERRAGSLFEYVHPNDVGALRAKFQQVVAGQLSGFSHHNRIRHKDGGYRWLESHYVSALDNPLINGVVINSRDITDSKQAEMLLAQREEVFRLAADAVDGVIYEWDLTRGIVHRSRGLREVLGMEPENLAPVAEAWCERIHPDDFAVYDSKVAMALLNDRGWTTTYRIRDARGRYRSILERSLIQRNTAGDPVRAIGCCVDVSQIKRLTDLLADTQRTAKTGGWEYSYLTHELTWTDEMYRIYEATPGDFVPSWETVLTQFTPESRLRFTEVHRRAEESVGEIDIELEIITLKNQRQWVRVIGHLELLDGRHCRAFGSVQNVQAKKLAQIALEHSTGWLKLSMNMAHMHAWRWDKATDTLEFATVENHEVHLPAVFPGMKKLMSRVHPKDRAAVGSALEHAFEDHAEMHHEFRLKSQDGRYRSYAAVARPLFDAAGEPSGLVGVTQDVTARRESEARLRRSEELLRATTANSADTLLLLDGELRVRFINRGVGDRSIEQIIGREYSALLPDAARALVIGKLRQVLRDGEPATYEFDAAPADVEIQYFENRAVLVRDGSVGSGISITVRNITERKRLEQEILYVASRERNSIGRDLHDGLGQELTGIALMLRGLATRIQKQSPDAVGYVNEIVALVNQSIESARALARGLLPVRTDSGGLPFALRALAARSRDLYGLDVNFRSEIWPELTLNETNASHLYRIAQEALTNAARHGHAATVDIFLWVTKSAFLLRITDDGVGIGAAAHSAGGMGLKIMKYRADMIGAKFDIGANEPQGTVVRVTGEQSKVADKLQSAQVISGGNDYGRE